MEQEASWATLINALGVKAADKSFNKWKQVWASDSMFRTCVQFAKEKEWSAFNKTFKEKCSNCRGNKVVVQKKDLEVVVEKGMKDQEHIVFERESEQHPDTIPGDLIIVLKQSKHHFFHTRKGDDLYADITLNMKEALLGFNKEFKHLDNREVKINKSKPTQPFEVKPLKGEGMPVHNSASNKGDLHLKFKVRLPEKLSDAEKSLIESIL